MSTELEKPGRRAAAAAHPPVAAVLFDLGGTLYDYRTLEPGNRESLEELASWAGIEAARDEIVLAQREALRRVFNAYLPRGFYLHRDLFRDALIDMLGQFGARLKDEHYRDYEQNLRARQRRDFALRKGVLETLHALRARGLVLGIVSNIDDDQLTDLTEAGGLENAFDWMLSSEAVRACKPHPAIFQAALERAGCRAEEALFVGDTLRQDVAGANQAGMRSVLLWHRDDREPPQDQSRPTHVIRRIPELIDLVERRV